MARSALRLACAASLLLALACPAGAGAAAPSPVAPLVAAAAPAEPTLEGLNEEVDGLRSDFADLRRTAAGPRPKDGWDKLSAVAALVSGLLVALIGTVATYLYNTRQSRAQRAQDEREARQQEIQSERDLQLRRIDTVRGFFEHLSGTDARQKRAALLMIESLDSELAVRLANAFRDEGSVSALSQIATSADEDVAESARAGLETALDALRASVVQVGGDALTATGFFVRSDGVIATTDYVLAPHADAIDVKLPDGTVLRADVLVPAYEGVVLLKVARDDVPALALAERTPLPEALQDVVVLGATPDGMTVVVGSVTSVSTDVSGLSVPGPVLFARLDIQPGQGGAPVVDATGRVAGLVYGSMGSEDGKTAILLPVDPLARALTHLDAGDEDEAAAAPEGPVAAEGDGAGRA
jgi:S1-C subfamily serine protease